MGLAFVERFPLLFHVTRRSALEGIGRHGVQPAAMLADGSGAADAIDCNRDRWVELSDAEGGPVWLRWQSLRDHVLRSRLPPESEPRDWRRFINSMVFLFPSLKDAERLRAFAADAGIEQVVLRFETGALLEAGCALHVCRWNNGYPDRRRPPRLRTKADYRPIADWCRGDLVREATVAGPIPPSVPFATLI